MLMLSGLLGFMLLGSIALMPDIEPPITDEEEFEPDAPELEEPTPPTDGPDLLWGRFLDDMIDGREGDDTLSGGFGNDTVIGGNGNDVVTGGQGDDDLQGLTGQDTISGDDGNDKLTGASGHDLLDGGAGQDTLSGGLGHDILRGGHVADALHGDDGDDGDDVLSGGSGNDSLMWGAGDDVLADTDLERAYLNGGSGDDIIQSYGADMMTGGEGADTFVYTDVGDEPIKISDYDPTVDTLAIQFLEEDAREISVRQVSDDVYEVRLEDQVAAYVTSSAPFDAASIVIQRAS